MNPSPRKPNRPDRILALLLILCLLVRLAAVFAYPCIVRFMPAWEWSNNDGYDAIAAHWVDTGTFALERGVPTAARLPLYPLLIAACYAVFGSGYPAAVMILQALLSVLTGFLLYRLADSVFGRRTAHVALALFILHPQVNNFIFRCATETLYTLIVTGLVYALVRAFRHRRPRLYAEAALWLGLSLLTRQTLAPVAWILPLLPFFTPCSVGSKSRSCAHRAHTTLIVLTVLALVLAPWLMRNYRLSGRRSVLQTWVGQPLYQGAYTSIHMNEFFKGEKTISDLDQEALAKIRMKTAAWLNAQPAGLRPVEREAIADRFARKEARALMRTDPGGWILRFLRNLLLAPFIQMTWKSSAVLLLWNIPLLLLSCAGLIRWLRSAPPNVFDVLPIVILFLYFWAVHAAVWPQARYLLPALIPFSALAGYTIAGIFK